VTTPNTPPPFFDLEAMIEQLEAAPSRWANSMRSSLEIERREVDGTHSTPARRAVYAALLAIPQGADDE
jgi:hypothetical protein